MTDHRKLATEILMNGFAAQAMENLKLAQDALADAARYVLSVKSHCLELGVPAARLVALERAAVLIESALTETVKPVFSHSDSVTRLSKKHIGPARESMEDLAETLLAVERMVGAKESSGPMAVGDSFNWLSQTFKRHEDPKIKALCRRGHGQVRELWQRLRAAGLSSDV